jgi:hypothetical protein
VSASTQILNADQLFFINGEKLSGVSSLSLGYTNPLENSPVLGDAGFGFSMNGPIEGVIEFSRSLIYQDPLLNFTGDSSFSGNFSYGNSAYSFASGYLTNYSVSCGVGDIPQVSARVSVWCGLTSGQPILSPQVDDGLFIPSPKSIVVSGMDFSSNRVRSCSYSLDISRQPVYSLEGGRKATAVNFIAPINISASVEMEVGASNMRNSYSFTEEFSSDTVNILIKDRSLTNTVANFSVRNAQLLGETIQTSADGQPVKNLSFGGFLS